jgi:hypothetical protein
MNVNWSIEDTGLFSFFCHSYDIRIYTYFVFSVHFTHWSSSKNSCWLYLNYTCMLIFWIWSLLFNTNSMNNLIVFWLKSILVWSVLSEFWGWGTRETLRMELYLNINHFTCHPVFPLWKHYSEALAKYHLKIRSPQTGRTDSIVGSQNTSSVRLRNWN